MDYALRGRGQSEPARRVAGRVRLDQFSSDSDAREPHARHAASELAIWAGAPIVPRSRRVYPVQELGAVRAGVPVLALLKERLARGRRVAEDDVLDLVHQLVAEQARSHA